MHGQFNFWVLTQCADWRILRGMIEVAADVFVGNAGDFELVRADLEWAVLQCAKEPWHREALGYTSRGAPKTHPEYLWAYRGNRLILNMVDAPQAVFFNPSMINEGLNFVEQALREGKRVLIHCNQGNSRAPAMALLYMKRAGLVDGHYEQALAHFKTIYPDYEPGAGIDNYVKAEFGPKTELEATG